MDTQNYIKKIFEIKTESDFNNLALKVFQYQYQNNPIYNQYINLIGYNVDNITDYHQIPFIPIELFRTQIVTSIDKNPEIIFLSSGTTTDIKSKHHVMNLDIYKKSILNCFKLFFGDPKEFVFFCLVPNFKINKNSSLSFMCSELIIKSQNLKSGFYLNRSDELISNIKLCQKKKKKFILFGLSFEILNFAEESKITLNGGYVIQTGGTKKNTKYIIQEDLHDRLKSLFNTEHIYSEYGMAELLSQSYYLNNHCFESPPWKKILIRDKRNPLKIIHEKNRGCINIIDLANINSCSFVATNDLGCLTNTGFNVFGRAQNASARGCNLMT